MFHTGMLYLLVTNHLISLYLEIRQLIALRRKQSTIAKKILNEEEYQKMIAYNRDKIIYNIITHAFDVMRDCLMIKYKILEYCYSKMFNDNSVKSGVLFYVAFFNIERILNLPFDLYRTFVVEQKHGFNKTTLSLYIADFLKLGVIYSLTFLLVLYGVLNIISWYTNNFYFYVWVFVVIVNTILVVIFPVYIQPLFNKFTEMEEGSLKKSIYELTKRIGFKASKLFVMDGSKRSGHSNAYFVGITKEKRVVLYDTLIEQLDENEVLAVLCHEFGHWLYNHTLKIMMLYQAIILGFLYLFNAVISSDYFNKEIFVNNEPVIIRMIYFTILVSIMNYPVMFIVNILIRGFEREADLFAVKEGYGDELSSGLIKIHKENKSNLAIDRLYSIIHNSHPTLVERLELIENAQKKQE